MTAPDPHATEPPPPAPGPGHRARVPGWVREPLIACIGGPLTGQWFTTADWHERLGAARRMRERGQQPTPVLAYSPTGPRVRHPHQVEATGAAWHHRPTTGQQISPHHISVPTGLVLTLDDLTELLTDGVIAILPEPDTNPTTQRGHQDRVHQNEHIHQDERTHEDADAEQDGWCW
jgi:hypothetical protein